MQDYKTIADQILGYCDCLPEIDPLTLAKDIEELINIVSVMTCWQQHPCETFLNSPRQEIIDDIPPLDCGCCVDPIIEFKPLYRNADPNSFRVQLVTIDGVHETVTKLSPDEYEYGVYSDLLRIDTSLFAKRNCCDECDFVKFKLIIDYNAGYEGIPDCLLPFFCDLLHVIYDKNNCDCSTCQACKANADTIDDDYSDELSPTIDDMMRRLVIFAYQKQFQTITLCGRRDYDLWLVTTHKSR